MSQAGKGWVNALIMRNLTPSDRIVAGVVVDSGKGWTKFVNISLILGPAWLYVCWAGKDYFPTGEKGDFIALMEWVVPVIFVALTIFPHSNSIQRAMNPYPLGTGHVPFFSTLPVSIRCLLRISQRITAVRCVIFAVITTPFFWALATMSNQPEMAAGLLAGIPAFAIVWCFARPIFIWHRIQAAIKRRRGIFLLHCATGSFQVALFLLWAIAGFSGVTAAYVWASERSFLLLVPVAVGGIVLSAIFSRILLEVAINEIRHLRYDWVAKPG